MPPLRELQTAFAEAVVVGRSASAEAAVRGDPLSSAARLRVYRNSVLGEAVEALRSAYPVVSRLVGDDCFQAAGRGYTESVPSICGDMEVYGHEFPRYLEVLGRVWGLPYLGGIAHLEWSCHEVLRASEPAGFDLVAVAARVAHEPGRSALRLSPSVRLVRSDYPILRIWEINREQQDVEGPVELPEDGDQLLVTRRKLGVGIRRLGPGEFELLSAIESGATLEIAFGRALGAQPDLDALALLRDNALSGLFISSDETGCCEGTYVGEE